MGRAGGPKSLFLRSFNLQPETLSGGIKNELVCYAKSKKYAQIIVSEQALLASSTLFYYPALLKMQCTPCTTCHLQLHVRSSDDHDDIRIYMASIVHTPST